MHGNSAEALELAEREEKNGDGDGDSEARRESVELGLMYRGMALRIGDAATLKALTSSALDEMILMALEKDERGEILKDEHARLEGEYLRTLGAIRRRLEGEKASIAEKPQDNVHKD